MLRHLVNIILLGILGFISCQKEDSCEGCRETNKFPVADAGNDQIISLQTDSILLDGSASKDPDGTIVSFQWSKISGPPSSSIASIAKPVVKGFSIGTYLFELKVTDNGGLSGKDTVMVTVDSVFTLYHPPVANSGPDQSVVLPVNSVTLDGRNSSDPDKNITGYLWTKVSGPSVYNVTTPAAMHTEVTGLVAGIYQFELKVTDAGGLFDTDTMEVRVMVNFGSLDCVIPDAMHVASFSSSRGELVSAVCDGKFYYSDGSSMDVFDPVSNTIIASGKLSMERASVAAISASNLVFFAGGYIYGGSQGTYISRVDIYNTTTGIWTTSELSTPRMVGAGACTIGNKVFFAGGTSGPNAASSRVDIYDLSTNNWTYRELSQPGTYLTAIVENKLWFITHGSSKIDVYDAATDSWSTQTLPSPNYGSGPAVGYKSKALQLGSKIYFTGSQQVNVYDIPTQSWSVITLSEQKSFIPAVAANGKIAFRGGMTSWFVYSSLIEVYDTATNSWSSITMSSDLYYEDLISYNNFIYSAGGATNQENTSLSGICRFGL